MVDPLWVSLVPGREGLRQSCGSPSTAIQVRGGGRGAHYTEHVFDAAHQFACAKNCIINIASFFLGIKKLFIYSIMFFFVSKFTVHMTQAGTSRAYCGPVQTRGDQRRGAGMERH